MAADDDVVVELVTTRGRALTRYGYLLTGDAHDAEDLVQDALVKVFGRRRAGLQMEVAEAYVRRTMLTLYVDGWRRRGRWAERRHLAAVPDHAEGPERSTATRLDVVAALGGLPRQQRACVVLRFYEDMTVAEIADALGIAEGSAKRYLSMGTHRLEALLGPVDGASSTVSTIEIVQEA